MQHLVITRKNLADLIDELTRTGVAGEVVGVKAKANKFIYGPLKNANELRLDYDVTLLPPKKYFFPQIETVLRYRFGPDPEVEPVISPKSLCVIGVHPYDIRGIMLFDAVYGGDNPDPNYFLKRNNTFIIGVDCLTPNPKSFAASMGSAITEEGFDIMLTDIGDEYFMSVASERGSNLLNKYAKTRDASSTDLEKRDKVRNEALKKYQVMLKMGFEEISPLLDARWDSKVFHDKAATCFNCGSCVMVCPTCVCFDVQDNPALNLAEGERFRRWDGCMLKDFAKVASGENFREHKEQRFRHRMYRKGKYMIERYKFPGCVGCGRCGIACLAQIASPAETFNLLKEGK